MSAAGRARAAVIEAARAVWGLIGARYMGDFAVVGGAALLLHGATIRTRDIDFGITARSMDAFARAAAVDSRFSQHPLGWEYNSTFGINVGIDFVEIGGGYLHQLQAYCLDETLQVASLVDLALAKGIAWVDRGYRKDLDGLQFVVGVMVRKEQNFRRLGGDERELLGEIIEGLDCNEGRQLHKVIRTLL
ncbi:hypothetical protein HOY80DRAFT_1141135 [Tuber brumale]|nr:hypothetical protein HOY80DRAFT_1141135 [Tuber brumale]